MKIFQKHVGMYSFEEKNQQTFAKRYTPKGSMAIWEEGSLRLILKDLGSNKRLKLYCIILWLYMYWGWRIFNAEPACFFVCLFVSRCCFLTKIKIAFKSSLELYFRPLITEFFEFVSLQFRIEEKIHTKAVIDVSKDCGEVVTEVTLLRR